MSFKRIKLQNKYKRIASISILMTIFFMVSMAQQMEFSQFYAAPLHLNPALAGISHGPRVALNYRNQWPELGAGPNGGFSTYGISYDQHIEQISSGVGVMFISDRIANNKIVQNSIHAAYSYQIRASKNFGIKMGLGGVYTHRYINWYDMLFYDQIDPLGGFYQSLGIPNSTNEIPPDNFNRHMFNANAGVVFFSSRHYGGVSVSNIVPERDYVGDRNSRLRASLHAGTMFKFGKSYEQKWWLSPQVLYAYQNNFNQFTVGGLIGFDFFYTGIWIRHAINNFDAVISGIGFKKGVLRFGYSFDINVSNLKGSAGSHEFSFVFNFTKEESSLNTSYQSGFIQCPYYLDF
jgi:type IX secretion system PorP/SprF family membrane protein